MIAPFLYLFVICLLFNYIRNGGSFVLFARAVEVANSIREPTPRGARDARTHLIVEYKFGHRIYSIIFPKRVPLRWTVVAALIKGKWVNKTSETEHYAGPCKDFYCIPIKPIHINPLFEKMAFQYEDKSIVKIDGDEIIISKLFRVKGNL